MGERKKTNDHDWVIKEVKKITNLLAFKNISRFWRKIDFLNSKSKRKATCRDQNIFRTLKGISASIPL